MTLTAADICWQSGQPRARDFDDIYFSRDGAQETQRVFMEPGQVLHFAQQQPQLCVAELGFGTGLNFAVCAREVLAHSNAHLHYIAFEKHPLRQTDWQMVTAPRGTELTAYAELRKQPLPVLPGWHQRMLGNGRITLSVFHGEVASGLADLVTRQPNPVDAWFLDGFAPEKNPSMWRPEIYRQLAQMARPGTTVSTFSAAGHVRRGLQQAGFAMRRIDQQPYKRESLAGTFAGRTARTQLAAPTTIAIHGAGIGGASMARHLAEQRVTVRVYDPNGVAQGASQIKAAVMHSRLLGDQSADADLRASAFHYASNYVQRFHGLATTGVLQVQGTNLDARKLERISAAYDAVHPDQSYWIRRLKQHAAAQLASIQVDGDALFFPTSGVVDLPALCASLLDHPLIDVVSHAEGFDASACNINCTGTSIRQIVDYDWLEIADVYGQIDWFKSPALAALPVIGNGYLVPTAEGCALGASYEHTPWSVDGATAHNLNAHAHYISNAGLQPADLVWQSRARGARAVTSDRIPVIGKMVDEQSEQTQWISTAFGSMGTTAAPLAAAMITSELLGWIPPVSAQVQKLTRPERFKERQARRGIRHVKTVK